MKRLLPIFVIIILVLIIRHIALSINNLITNQKTVQTLKQQEQQAIQNNKYLSQRLQYVQQNKFVEQEARDKLGMVKNGEVVVLLPSPTPTQLQVTTHTNEPNWLKWWKLFFN